MAQPSQRYTCSNCAYSTIKWLGCCPGCRTFDSLHVQKAPTKSKVIMALKTLSEITAPHQERIMTGVGEWQTVTGGGIVPGSFIALTGDPGIGKSTLLLQLASEIARSHEIVYISTEESLEQIKLRAERLACVNENILFSDQAELDAIISGATQKKPQVLIIDSLQNSYHNGASPAGSITYIKEAALRLMRLAKDERIAIITTSHITKEGIMAGPKMLEHMVDVVLYLQADDRWDLRVLRAVKNRFGAVNELGFFKMETKGLREVPNINEHLLEEVSWQPGSVLMSYLEGSRPLLIELQALVLPSKYGVPQRIITGIDHQQVALITAVIEKFLNIKLSGYDIFFKISGSFKVKSHSADLAIALALLSSFFQKPLPEKSLALAEISLTGQIKPINGIGLHTREAERFGISTFFLSSKQKIKNIKHITHLSAVYDLLEIFA